MRAVRDLEFKLKYSVELTIRLFPQSHVIGNFGLPGGVTSRLLDTLPSTIGHSTAPMALDHA
jgi:hypothetical protein